MLYSGRKELLIACIGPGLSLDGKTEPIIDNSVHENLTPCLLDI